MATPKNQSVLKAFAMLKAFRSPDEWLTSCEFEPPGQTARGIGLPPNSDIGGNRRGRAGLSRPLPAWHAAGLAFP